MRECNFRRGSRGMRGSDWLAAGLFVSLLGGAGFAAGGCSSDGGSTSPSADAGSGEGGGQVRPSSGLPCAVDDVLEKSCRRCHSSSPQFGAPMPLMTHADLVAPAPSDPNKRVIDRAIALVSATTDRMPPPPNQALGAAEIQALSDWESAGAREANETCGGGSQGGGRTLDCTPDLTLAPSSKYAMPKTTEDAYVCYGVELTLTDKRQAIAIAPRIDNSTIVHHVLLFDAADALPTTPAPCPGGGGALQGWRMLYGWAPGGDAVILPQEAGLPLEPTRHFVVQVHYSNIGGLDAQTDGTGFDVCTTNQLRPNEADVMAFGTMSFSIPARAKTTKTCDVTVPPAFGQIHLVGLFPHMHQLGESISLSRVPQGGAEERLVDVPAWNFDAQPWYASSATLAPGDAVRASCTWNNTTSSNVEFGEKTLDEMCYVFALYYPKVTSQNFSWLTPSLTSSCQ